MLNLVGYTDTLDLDPRSFSTRLDTVELEILNEMCIKYKDLWKMIVDIIFVWQKRVAVKKELCHKTEVQKLDDFLIDLSSNAYILCHYDFCQN